MVVLMDLLNREDEAPPFAVVALDLVWKILATLIGTPVPIEVEVAGEEEEAVASFGELNRARFVAGEGTAGVEAGAAKNLLRDVCCFPDDMTFESCEESRIEERRERENNASRVHHVLVDRDRE